MKVLLVGSGAREHALGWKLKTSPRVAALYSAPGNPGLEELGPTFDASRPDDLVRLATRLAVDLVVVGPEAPLAAGLVDRLGSAGIPAFGPTSAAARLEASKSFAKEVMVRAGVPTGSARSFTDEDEAVTYIRARRGPWVVKADGLAAGKGVLVTDDPEAAVGWVHRCLSGGFGDAGKTVLVEEFLSGPELSVFAVASGTQASILEPARDYKRLLDGDRGPNTGGMGSYSPVDLPDGLLARVETEIIRPTLTRMAEDGSPFTGFLYAGLVLTDTGPKVIEFNVRLGDPEAQVLLPRLDSDLIELIEAALTGRLDSFRPRWSDRSAVNVVLASAGYPDRPRTGDPITGLAEAVDEGALVFHAGTARDGMGRLVTNGGRVLNVVGVGSDLCEARRIAYRAVSRIRWQGMQYRSDIAL
ncbi:MAG: phosphoribosylamine--glycine ligase [Acidimicrobiia bacterium]|nr:MAG: phosphoribosylamine--glycine ligase [Acidimicrobiia bacterium]